MPITAETFINAPLEKVWEVWTNAAHIARWNNISEQWHTPAAKMIQGWRKIVFKNGIER